MLSKKEKLLKENYKVNEKEYIRLLKEEHEVAWDFEEWKLFYKYMSINKNLNDLFQNDPFIYKLLCSHAYSNIIKDKNKSGYIGELNTFSFDHTTAIQLSPEVNIRYSDTVTGVVTFPYFHSWDEIENWIDKVPKDNYRVYIMNPILIFYGLGTVGLFLTPTFANGANIELCNRYIIGLTGYPLFLTFSNEEHVGEIRFADLGLCKEDFVEELYELSGKDMCLLKALNFWKENDDVSIPLIEESYKHYLDVQPYISPDTINFVKIISKRHFQLVHEDTDEILGPFKKFNLDQEFKVIDTENGVFKLSDSQLSSLLEGKYDFLIIEKGD